MISYNNAAPKAVNNVGQFGATEGTIGAYKSAAEYASDAKYWALLSQTKYTTVEDILAEVERLWAQGELLEEDIKQLKVDFETQQQELLGLIQSTGTAIDNANSATELSKEATQAVLAQLDIISNMTVQATLLPPGSMATGSYDNSTGVFSFGIPEGQPGRDGTDGTISDIGDVAVGVPVSDDYGFYVDKENGGLYRAKMSDIANLIPSIRSISINGGEEQTGSVVFDSVSTFNGRKGAVVAESGDYTAAQVGAFSISNNLSEITNTSAAIKNIGLAGYGIGSPSLTSIAAFDWQTHDFVNSSRLSIQGSTALNAPVSYPNNLGYFLEVVGVSGNTGEVRITPNTGVDASYVAYSIRYSGSKGSRIFSVRAELSSAIPVTISQGGTGATTAANARTNLGLGLVATESIVPVTKGGTGSTSAENARLALVAAKSGVNSDITSMTNGVTFTQPVSVADAVDATNAVNLGQISSDQGASLIGTLEGVPVQNIISNINTDIIQLKLNWAIENGYSDIGFTFTTGGTLTVNDRDKVVYDPVSKTWYSYAGTLPVVVPASFNPVGDANWKPQTDPVLREELASSEPGKGVSLVHNAAKQSDLNTLNTTVESRNYAKYTKAAELAKLLSAGGTFVIDCYGDSTMWGATVGELGTQNTFNPPAVLKTTITNLYGVTLTVNNFGISGTTIAQMLAGTDVSTINPVPFSVRIAATAATLIYCNHCINDSQLDNDIHQYRLNLIEFVRLCRLYNKVPVLVTPNTNPAVPGAAIITEAKSKRLRNYVKVMREVAHDLDVDLVDNFYYYEQTARMVSPVSLVPDGAHPSTEGYKMSGRNMAIPLVCAHTLSKAWDKAGLSNSTYFDNIMDSRQYQTTGGPFNRFDGSLSGNRTASLTGINMAVILDKPTDDTVLAVYGLQWGSGTISELRENGFAVGDEFGGDINQFNNVTPLDWDACHIPPRCKLYAGLHVIGMLTSTEKAGAAGEGFAFSGLGLVPRVENGSGMTSANEIRNFNVICTNSELTFDLPLFDAGTQFSLKGCSNDAPVINLEWNGSGTALNLTTSLGGSYTIAGAVTSAVYRARFKFNSDKSISVTVGSVSITVPAGISPWPNMYVGSLGICYNVKYLG